jgi:L-fuconolactonase
MNDVIAVQAKHHRVRNDWLRMLDEPVIDPSLPIIDPHHHLWQRPNWAYFPDDLIEDISSGHNVRSTIFVECRTNYRKDGPQELKPIGEVEFAADCGKRVDSQKEAPRICEGIIGHANLCLGSDVAPVLDALAEASIGRFRGIRYSTAWDIEPDICNPELGTSPDISGTAAFRQAVALLGRRNLVYDAWVYHPQLHQVAELARACPDTQVVLDHAGGPVGIGRYQSRREDGFKEWRLAMKAVSACPNIAVKIGGLAMRISGYDFHAGAMPPSSEQIAQAFKAYVETCIEYFGVARCMFESNFPVDKASYSYRVLWNAYKRITTGLSTAEKTALFAGTAAKIYRLKNIATA